MERRQFISMGFESGPLAALEFYILLYPSANVLLFQAQTIIIAIYQDPFTSVAFTRELWSGLGNDHIFFALPEGLYERMPVIEL